MVLGDSTIKENRPITPKENEDLLSMLRTRWADGAFSDIKVIIFDREYLLHRMVLCRSPFFDRLLQGEWNETHERVLKLEVPATITCESFELSLSHMYANPVSLNRHNVFQVMAAACYLDLQELCTQCSEYIIDAMHDPEAFLEFYRVGTDYEYGVHSDRIKKSGWHHLCMMGVDHLRKILPSLDIHTIKRLLVSDEFWIRTELDRYKLVKEILFPKMLVAREHCKEHGGVDGMPSWLPPALASPRDPWIPSDNVGKNRDKIEAGPNHPGNHLLDSAEIKEDTTGGSDSQGGMEQTYKLTSVEVQDPTESAYRGPIGTSAMMDDHSSQGDNTGQDTRMELEEAKDVPEVEEHGYGLMGDDETYARIARRDAVTEVRDVFQAITEVLGLEGIKYSHIQHADLSRIEIEFHEMGLNRAHHALLQGMRTQDILFRRIEACSTQEEPAQGGRSGSYPKNLHPYSQKDLQHLYSRWWLPSFRFGVEFADVKNITPQTEQISEAHYYAGSVWKVRLLIDDDKNEVRLHLFRNQRKIGRVGGMQVAFDSRDVVCTRFKFLVPSRDGMAARSSRPGRFQQKKGRGWNDFLKLDTIENFLTPWGSLRVIVIVYPPFETD